jgi:hypothetical protein
MSVLQAFLTLRLDLSSRAGDILTLTDEAVRDFVPAPREKAFRLNMREWLQQDQQQRET